MLVGRSASKHGVRRVTALRKWTGSHFLKRLAKCTLCVTDALKIASANGGDFDQLNVDGIETTPNTGIATLAGTLTIELLDGTVPLCGVITILTADEIIGAFDTVVCDVAVEVIYTEHSVSLVFAGRSGGSGDVNGDALVDGADLGLLLASWGTCGGTCCADFNDDQAVDGLDLGILIANWS